MNRFVIADSTLCIGCHTCEAACSETHRQHGLQSMPRLKVMLNEKESAPQLCHQRMLQAQVSVLRVRIDNDLPRGAARLRTCPGQAPERSVIIGSGLVHGGLLARIFSIVTHRAPQEKGRSALPCAKKQTDTEMSVCLLVF